MTPNVSQPRFGAIDLEYSGKNTAKLTYRPDAENDRDITFRQGAETHLLGESDVAAFTPSLTTENALKGSQHPDKPNFIRDVVHGLQGLAQQNPLADADVSLPSAMEQGLGYGNYRAPQQNEDGSVSMEFSLKPRREIPRSKPHNIGEIPGFILRVLRSDAFRDIFKG